MELLNDSEEEIFNAIFVERDRSSWISNSEDDFEFVYENAYKLLPVHIGDEKVNEFLFRCFVRDLNTQKIKQYFVSEEYDVNLVDIVYSPIAGRFIFSYDQDNRLRLRALAEESAMGSILAKSKMAELYYVKLRKNDGRSK